MRGGKEQEMEGTKERNRETGEPDLIAQRGALYMADVKSKMELILPSAAPADHMTPAVWSLWQINTSSSSSVVKQACNFLFMLLSLY